MYGRDRGHLVWGIDQWGLREVSGEAMGWEMVGGVQLRSGALGGDGMAQGRREVAVLGLYKARPGRCVSRAAIGDWGSRAAGWSKNRGREGFWAGVGLGLLLPPLCQLNRTRGKVFPQFLWSQRGDLQLIPFPPLGQFEKERKRNKEG
jgi:hypothetical protein